MESLQQDDPRLFVIHDYRLGRLDKVSIEEYVFLTLCKTCKQYVINFKEYMSMPIKIIINGNINYEMFELIVLLI